jgi:hypothetical protein
MSALEGIELLIGSREARLLAGDLSVQLHRLTWAYDFSGCP